MLLVMAGCALLLGSCAADERWEGTLQSCDSNGFSDRQVLLVIDSPRTPSPTGWAGQAGSGDHDTWELTKMQDVSGFINTLNYTARYDVGSGSIHSVEDWKMTLTKDGLGKYNGDAEITVTLPIFGNTTVRCKVALTRKN